ncbi:MAG: hypothetical protein ACOCX1_06370 [Fimbriimonadaceae bacterium]
MNRSKSVPSRIAHGLLGLIYVLFSADYFANRFFGAGFMPEPPGPPPEAMQTFMGGLMAAGGTFFLLVKIVEFVGGLLVLTRKFAPLGLLLTAPVTVSIAFANFFFADNVMGVVLSILLLLTSAYLGFVVYWDQFKLVLTADAPESVKDQREVAAT